MTGLVVGLLFMTRKSSGLLLNRTGFSSLTVHTWQMTKELDEEGYCVQTKHVVVEFILSGVSGWI
jgi:hypothetical protein